MLQKKHILQVVACFVITLAKAQNPLVITDANPPTLSATTYSRAQTKINLLPGYKYKASNIATPIAGESNNLLNLSIGTYANNVSTIYGDTMLSINPQTFNPSAPVGATEGLANVTPAGAFNYQIPIVCSPGLGSAQPNLSISYNSNSGVTNLGLGFSLNGISSITRTNKTFFYDGLNKPISLNYNDAFALDGQRMLIKSGTYGQPGSTYALEIENYSNMEAFGTHGSGPSHFIIYTADGKIIEYGNTPDSKQVAANLNEVLTWYINKITDEFGNYMTFTYNTNNGETSIMKIEYSGNTVSGMNPYNSITFEYFNRTDIRKYYFGTGEFNLTKLLKSITCKDINNNIVRKCNLDYQYSNSSILSKISEVDSKGNSLNPTYFDWNKLNKITGTTGAFPINNGVNLANPINLSQVVGVNGEGTPVILTNTVASSDNICVIPVDINGDGKKDIVSINSIQSPYINTFVPMPTTFNVYLSTANSTSPNQRNSFQKESNPASFNTQQISSSKIEILGTEVYDEDDDDYEEVFITIKLGQLLYLTYKIKFNGSSYNLSIHKGPTQINYLTYHSNFFGPSAFNTVYPSISKSSYLTAKVDIDGDKIPEGLSIDQNFINTISSTNQSILNFGLSDLIKAKLGDFNGDGVSDIFVLTAINPNPSSQGAPINFAQISTYISGYEAKVISYDQITNAFKVIATKQLYPNIVGSISTSNPFDMNELYRKCSENIDFADFNGDGKTDILFNQFTSLYTFNNPGNANLTVVHSNGQTFENDKVLGNIPTVTNGYSASFFAGDVNNDGNLDWVANSYDDVNFVTQFLVYDSNSSSITNNPISYSKSAKFASSLGDFDGDGTLDYLSQNTLGGTPSIEYSVFNKNNRQFLSKISTLQSEFKVEYSKLSSYKASNNFPLYNKTTSSNPATINNVLLPVNVVSSTFLNNKETKFYYENCLLHKQAKGFLGFEKTISLHIATGNLAVNSFTFDAVSDYVKSSSISNKFGFVTPNSFIQYNFFAVKSKQTSTYNYLTTGNNRCLINTSSVSKNYVSSINQYEETNFDNTKKGSVVLQEKYSTPWLNPSQKLISDLQVYTYQQITNPLSGQILFKPLKLVVTKSSNNTSSGNFSSSFHTDFSFDAAGHLASKIENSNLPSLAVTTTYPSYDVFGNPLSVNVSANDLALPRIYNYTYDNTGRFLKKKTNALNNFEEYDNEPSLGNLISSKNINGLITKFEYDGLGRIIKSTSPTNAISTKSYEWYAYPSPLNSANTLYGKKLISYVEGGTTTEDYFDVENNLIESRELVFGGNQKIMKYTYNANKQLLQEKQVATINPLSGDIVTDYAYDPFNILQSVTQKVGNTVLNKVDYTYNLWSLDNSYKPGFLETKSKTNNVGEFYFVKKENNEASQIEVLTNYTSTNPTTKHKSNYKFNEFNLPYSISNVFGSAPAIVTTIGYDAIGRKQSLNDPSSGISTWQQNSIGELIQETNPNGNYNFTYDNLGRLSSKNSSAGNNYTYQYFTSGSGKQQLEKVTSQNEEREFKYDNYGRLIEKKQTLITSANKVLKTNYSYNKYNQLVNYTYPNNFTISKEYDAIGTLIKIKNNNTKLWELNTIYTPNLIASYNTGNGFLPCSLTYDANQNLQSKTFGGLMQQNYYFAPENNNLLQRTANNLITNANNNENFVYDDLDRLTNTKYIDNFGYLQNKSSVNYLSNGNINQKSDAGTYAYANTAKPYQLTNVNNPVGNISLNTLNVSYTDFKKVSQITEATSNKQFDFMYGSDEQRIRMDYKLNGILQYTRFYSDDFDTQQNTNGSVKEWNYVYAPTGLCAINYNNNGNSQLLYVNTDHLGSPVLVANAAGTILEEYSYDAWGRRRNPADWNDYSNNITSTYMIRGYTGHEMLDEVGIINMNGRIYDPVLGRFLQPDNFVQAPGNLQNYNRYSYAINNPLKYTDPTGNEFTVPVYTPPVISVPTYNYSSYNYASAYNSGYGGINTSYGGSYNYNYSANTNYNGYSTNINYSYNYTYNNSVTYNPDYVTMNSSVNNSYSYGFSGQNQSYNAAYSNYYNYNVSYPNYDYLAKNIVFQAGTLTNFLTQNTSSTITDQIQNIFTFGPYIGKYYDYYSGSVSISQQFGDQKMININRNIEAGNGNINGVDLSTNLGPLRTTFSSNGNIGQSIAFGNNRVGLTISKDLIYTFSNTLRFDNGLGFTNSISIRPGGAVGSALLAILVAVTGQEYAVWPVLSPVFR